MGVTRRILEKDPKTGEVVAVGISLGAGLGKAQSLTNKELELDAFKDGVKNVEAGPARKPVDFSKKEEAPVLELDPEKAVDLEDADTEAPGPEDVPTDPEPDAPEEDV